MNEHFQAIIREATGAREVSQIEVIQNLWSGYGKIVRCGLKGTDMKTVVVKHVRLPEQDHHPRGWNTDLSHERKIKSYQVETAWYDHWSNHCDDNCRIPSCLALESHDDEVLMVLEDLDDAGFPGRKNAVTLDELKAELAGQLSCYFYGRTAHQYLW